MTDTDAYILLAASSGSRTIQDATGESFIVIV